MSQMKYKKLIDDSEELKGYIMGKVNNRFAFLTDDKEIVLFDDTGSYTARALSAIPMFHYALIKFDKRIAVPTSEGIKFISKYVIMYDTERSLLDNKKGV